MLSSQSETEYEGVSWGLGIGLQASGGGPSFWHWGDNGDFKAFAVAYKYEKLGVVYFANSGTGLSIVGDLVRAALGGSHPAIDAALADDYDFLDSHNNVALAVLSGAYDAGAVKEEVFFKYQPQGLQLVQDTSAISEHVFVAHGLNSKTTETLKQAMRNAPASVLTPIKKTISALVPAQPQNYDNLRRIMQRVGGNDDR